MKNQLQYFICRICAFLFLPLTGMAQDMHFEMVQRPEDQTGLQIFSLVQDNRGFLWIGIIYTKAVNRFFLPSNVTL
jgi:hypothetical protein